MNAGRDVERLIAGWLTEEAPGRAPDRLLESTADVIDRTKQRRFGAAWRDPVTLSLRTLVAAAAVIVAVVAGAAFVLPGDGPGSLPSPSPSPTSAPIARPSSTPRVFTGACSLVTSDEAERISGRAGLGALPFEAGDGDVTRCQYSDGGGNVVLRLTWTKVGGGAAFDLVRSTPDIESVTGIGDEAFYDPASRTLHVRVGDAVVAIVATPQESSTASRRLAAESIGELIATRM